MRIIKQFDAEYMTLKEVCSILDLSDNAIYNHIENNGFPYSIDPEKKNRNNRYYKLADVLLWYVKYYGNVKDEELSRMDLQRLEKLTYEAKREKLKYETEAKSLIPASQITEAFSRTMTVVNTMREGFGDACSMQIYDGLTKEEIAKIIQNQIDQIFTKMNDVDFLENDLEEEAEEA